MTIFLILAPFGSFALLMLVTSAPVALFTAAAICLAVITFDLVRGRHAMESRCPPAAGCQEADRGADNREERRGHHRGGEPVGETCW